jgi:hypothetical protein
VRIRQLAALALLVCLAGGTGARLLAQAPSVQPTAPPASRPKSQTWKRPVLSVSVGIAFPLSKDAVKRYWNSGMTGSISLLLPAQRSVLVGLAFDASALTFDEPAFTTDYPTVPPNAIDLGVFNLQLLARGLFRPGMRLSPWIEGGLGGAFVTGATYREVIDGVRHTYYDVKRTTRLSVSGSAGADIFFTAAFAFTIRGKFTYLVNDPSIGVMLLADAGLRFRL